MTTDQRKAHIIETGASTFAVTIDVSGHTIIGDEPVEAGGKDVGPAPYDLLLASLGECTAMTVRWYAHSNHLPLDKVEIHVTHHKEDSSTGKVDVFTKEVILHGNDLTEEQRAKLVNIASKCPIHRTLDSTPRITTSWGTYP
ncbi:OsmC family protein [Candidatus Paracaedibacter symbiosus]|uniref:OsmC family protein n=1 Tax=Candidatus Paracaedibacter symbiosus TaxID=244582 RepID=UPI0005097CA2|nr:OsmC family protein [Candidatus Paracaedibacter symbiosus]